MEMETSDVARVRGAIVEATVQHYPLLSDTQEVNAKVGATSGTALSCVKRLNESLAKLQVLSQAMTHTGQQWRREKQIALNTVSQHQKLIAFLEAPAVLEDCICNEMYHEAMMVLEHIIPSAQLMNKVELFRRVEANVRRTLERCLTDIVFPRLAESLTVASAVKLTTFLRRLGVCEEQIREVFLWKRAEFVDAQLREPPGVNSHSSGSHRNNNHNNHNNNNSSHAGGGVPYARVFRHVSAFKVHVSEVILQYAACFSPTAASPRPLAAWCRARAFLFVESVRGALSSGFSSNFSSNFSSHLSSHLSSHFSSNFSSGGFGFGFGFGFGGGSELAAVAAQCRSAAAAAAPVQMDVAALLAESVAAKVRAAVAAHIEAAAAAYKSAMAAFSWRVAADAQWGKSGKQREKAEKKEKEEKEEHACAAAPPVALMQWMPLAYALNGLLAAFNAVRKCIVPGVELFCVEQVEQLLRTMARDVAQDKELLMAIDEAERHMYLMFVNAFVHIFYPHVLACVRSLLGDEAQRILQSRMRDAVERLRSILPPADEEEEEEENEEEGGKKPNEQEKKDKAPQEFYAQHPVAKEEQHSTTQQIAGASEALERTI